MKTQHILFTNPNNNDKLAGTFETRTEEDTMRHIREKEEKIKKEIFKKYYQKVIL